MLSVPSCDGTRDSSFDSMKSPLNKSVFTAPSPVVQPTLRSIARSLGLSRTTVSDALRGNSRVHFKTVKRVRAAAEAAGYHRNPLAGAVMSLLRKSHGHTFRRVVAVIETVSSEYSQQDTLYREALSSGIEDRAWKFGYKAELFKVGSEQSAPADLEDILQARGIQGLLILPSAGFPDCLRLNWHRYAAVYLDYSIDWPLLHSVCPDHYRSMTDLLRELHARGYRRPGLCVDASLNERFQFRWEGAFLAQQQHLPEVNSIPPLRLKKVNEAEFSAWFKRYLPDVVLGHFPEVIPWMEDCGGKIPGTHGFVCLNHLCAPVECAAIDFQPASLGARATEIVITHLLHGTFGVPNQALLTTLPAKFIEGKTLLRRRSERI